MEHTKEDLVNIKNKLIDHISKNYEPEKSKELIESINIMNDGEFLDFLKEQGLIKEGKEPCIFCSIVFGEIPSTKIEENEKAIAILDINPASLGHTLIIPKEHLDKNSLPREVEELTDSIKEKLTKTFNPKKIEVTPSNIMGHEIINIIPVFNNENINSKRKKLSEEELKELKKEIEEKNKEEKRKKVEEKKEDKNQKEEEINEKNTWLPRRFP